MKAATKCLYFYSTLYLQSKELNRQVLTSANKTSTNRSKMVSCGKPPRHRNWSFMPNDLW